MEVLSDEVTFRKEMRDFGLNVPETHLIMSVEEAISVLYPEKSSPSQGKQYTIKNSSATETGSSDMTLLSSSQDIQAYIKFLGTSPTSPFILQESITGLQYTTHSLIIDNKPSAFVAYHSSIIQLIPLPASSLLSRSMLEYTTILTSKLSTSTSSSITRYLSLTFLIPDHLAQQAVSKCGVPDSEVHNLVSKIFAIDCRPTLGLGALAFADVSEDLASAYLSVLPDHEPKGISNGHRVKCLVTLKPGIPGCYFLAVEIIMRLVLLPLVQWMKGEWGLREAMGCWMKILGLVLWWKEGWWEVWDPWVAWWGYGGCAAGRGLLGLWEGRGWRVNAFE